MKKWRIQRWETVHQEGEGGKLGSFHAIWIIINVELMHLSNSEPLFLIDLSIYSNKTVYKKKFPSGAKTIHKDTNP